MSENNSSSNTEEAWAPRAKKPRVAGYRMLAVIVFILTVGGLFLGLIGGRLYDTFYSWTGMGRLSGSLLGYCITYLELTFKAGLGNTVAEIVPVLCNLLLVLLLFSAVAVTLICLIVTFISRIGAKKCAMVSAIYACIAYGVVFLWSFCHSSFAASKFTGAVFDIPVTIIAGLLLFALVITAIAREKWWGLLNTLLLVFSLAMLFALCYPGSYTATAFSALLVAFSNNIFVSVTLLIIALLMAVDLVACIIRLCARRAYLFDCIRFGISLLAIVLLFIATACTETPKGILFGEGSLLASLTLLISTVAACMLSLTLIFTRRMRAEEPESDDVPWGADNLFENLTFDTGSDFSARAPVQEETYFSQFEREMMGFATGHAPAAEPPTPPFNPQPVYHAPAQTPYIDPNTLYTYDPFINTLTLQEKNEFGDLFIARKNGQFGDLPTYTIGGDNTEFFRKVWIRYSTYEMSPELKEKLYQFIKLTSKT